MASFFEIEYCGQIKHVEVVDKLPQSGGTLPQTITFDGAGCKSYTFSANCAWDMTSDNPRIIMVPSTGAANVLYNVSVCYMDGDKISVTYAGNTYVIPCDETGTLSWYNEYRKSGVPEGRMQSITDAVIGNCVTTIADRSFSVCKSLTSVTIPDSVTTIADQSFDSCSGLTSITIPGSVTSIGRGAFYGCSSLISANIPDGITIINPLTFDVCRSLTSITIPDGVTSIGFEAFNDCTSLTSVTIPDSVTSIGRYGFGGCNGLTSVIIGSGITELNNFAFSGCSSLTSITINAENPPTIGSAVFNDTNNCPIYVPSASVGAYRAAWGYVDRIQPKT